MSENREIYTAGKNFTLPPALTAPLKGCRIKYFGKGIEWDVELELGNVDKCKPAQFDLPTDN